MFSKLESINKHPLTPLLLLFTFTRLINLTLLPVFSDEALYMFWGWQVWEIPGRFWHPLTDAKQPFLMWLFGLGQNIFPDPLFGARLVSVGTGLLSLLGLWTLCRRYFGEKAAILVSILYILIPLFLFYDRQALMESAIVACAVWSLYFLLRLLDTGAVRHAVLLGLTLGLGFFTKSSAAIFLTTTLAVLWIRMLVDKKTFIPLFLSQIYILVCFLIVNLPLFFQPLYWSTLDTNSRWTFTLPELLHFPVTQWSANLTTNTWIAFLFLTPSVFLLAVHAIRKQITGHKSQITTILFWFSISLLQYLFILRFNNFMSMRYLTPLLPPLLILAALTLSQITSHKSLFTVLSLIPPAAFSLLLLLNPVTFFRLDAKINPYSYIKGYLTGHDTGYQVNRVVDYFRHLDPGRDLVVTMAVHTFNPESGVWDYLRKDPRMTVSFMDGMLFPDLTGIDCLASPRPVYFMAKLDDTAGLSKYLEKVTVITNPYNPDYTTIYRLKQDCTGSTVHLNLTN